MPFEIEALPFATFASRLLALYQPPLRRAATYDTMRRVLRILGSVPGVLTTADLTTETIAAYIAQRSAQTSRNTVIGELGYLRAACSYAAEEGLLARPPSWKRLRLKRGPLLRTGHHGRAEIARVLAHLAGDSASWEGHRLFALAATVAYTGLRRDEALYLHVEDVDLAASILEVVMRSEDGLKTEGSEAPVPIPPPLAEVLAAWLPRVVERSAPLRCVMRGAWSEKTDSLSPRTTPHASRTTPGGWLFPGVKGRGPWTGGMPGSRPLDRLKAAGRAVGVEGLTWQSLRHSWATHAESAWGLSEGVIQRVLRHTTPGTQRHYRHADLVNLSAAVAGVSYR